MEILTSGQSRWHAVWTRPAALVGWANGHWHFRRATCSHMKMGRLIAVLVGTFCGVLFAEDTPVYKFDGRVETSKPDSHVWRSSAGFFKIEESSPRKILTSVFPEHRGVHSVDGARDYLYLGVEHLPKDQFFSAIVPYDTESSSKLLRDLAASLALEIRVEKRSFPCRFITDIAKPYPAAWTPDGNWSTAEGQISKAPVLCVLYRCAGRAPDGIQYVIGTKDRDLSRYRLSTLTETMDHDEVLTALGMPVDKSPREFDCLVISKPAAAPTAETRPK
jgi:hypothetical protein